MERTVQNIQDWLGEWFDWMNDFEWVNEWLDLNVLMNLNAGMNEWINSKEWIWMRELTGSHPIREADLTYALERKSRARAKFDGPGSDL